MYDLALLFDHFFPHFRALGSEQREHGECNMKSKFSMMNIPGKISSVYKHKTLEDKVGAAIEMILSGSPHIEEELRFINKVRTKLLASGDNPALLKEIDNALNANAMRFI